MRNQVARDKRIRVEGFGDSGGNRWAAAAAAAAAEAVGRAGRAPAACIAASTIAKRLHKRAILLQESRILGVNHDGSGSLKSVSPFYSVGYQATADWVTTPHLAAYIAANSRYEEVQPNAWSPIGRLWCCGRCGRCGRCHHHHGITMPLAAAPHCVCRLPRVV